MKSWPVVVALVLIAVCVEQPRAQQGSGVQPADRSLATGVTVLTATAHPPMPRELSLALLIPDKADVGRSGVGALVSNVARLYGEKDFTKALGAASPLATQPGPLALYAAYYMGLSQLKLDKPADALRTFTLILAQRPVGYLAEAALLGVADANVALNKPAEAVEIYERLLADRPSSVEDILMRLGRAATAQGDVDKAAEAFSRVFYEFALGESAAAAGTEMKLLGVRAITPNSPRFRLELGRAQRLLSAKLYKDARETFGDLASLATGDDKNLITLRIAECDYYLRRFRIARDDLKPLTDDPGPRQAEALYFYAMAARDLGDGGTFLTVTQQIAKTFPTDPFAEQALDSLANFYVRQDEDEKADAAFRELLEKFPTGGHAERAAWKVGWRAYRAGRYDETVRYFEQGSANFPRSDFRPSWLYWAARAHERLSNRTLANLRYGIVVADYMNTYYGRLAADRLGASATAAARAATASLVQGDIPLASALPGNSTVIKALLGARMFGDALNELRYARRSWGSSSAVEATIAWTNQEQSRTETGMRRFQLVRGAINTMRRAYPQFLTVDGAMLPHDVQTVIYPIAYWELIEKYSALNGLDPYLVAALVLQESTYVADIRSHANAYGLMQLLPSTARQYARKLRLPYSSRLLTNPEANIRMGTAYLADKMRQFGGIHLALASYNAGEGNVQRWLALRQGIEREEFIDDIPYAETQGYVRKIIGMAEDYRRLYGSVDPSANGLDKVTAAPRATKAPVARIVPHVKSRPRARARA
ncbi:MAG: transglycosylase SLT domain-containing protein [Vicinamibacterales bacterium]